MLKIALLPLLALTFSSAYAETNVIYGPDNRLDVYEVRNAVHKRLAQSTAGMVSLGTLTYGSSQSLINVHNPKTLTTGQNICSTEKFADQYLAPMCSGFLVAPDLIVTAGHCFKTFSTPENVCKSFAWVFDYQMNSATSNPAKDMQLSNIYACKSVYAVLNDSMDFAIVKLNRKVTGRTPLTFRQQGIIPNSTELLVIGHPSGLPTKVSDKGRITRNSEVTNFSTTLDTFHGNSGSAVFDAKTGLVEGILIQGKTDYVPSDARDPNSCQVVNRCDETANNCLAGAQRGAISAGEVVLRIERIASQIKAMSQAK